MNKYLILSIILFVSLIEGHSQEVAGKVVDDKRQPLEFANVLLLNQKDSAFVAGTISNVEGVFMFSVPTTESSMYIIKVSSVGYQTICRPVTLGDVGVIVLNNDAQLLGEVVIKGDLPKTRLKGDALVTNVAGSILAKAGTAEDVLAKIPGVTANDGALNVFGRGTPVVYINGREVRDASELDQLSSDNIKSIDVVTNPGARYAASIKAVIRIQTKNAIGDGLGFNNRAFVKYDKEWSYLDQFNFNYRKDKFDLIGTLYYGNNSGWRNYDAVQNTYLDSQWKQQTSSNQTTKYQQLIGDMALNYVFNADHSLGVSYKIDRQPDMSATGFFNTDVYQDEQFYEQTLSDSYGDRQSTQQLFNFYYNGKVKEWNIDFNADVLSGNEHVGTESQEHITDKAGVESSQRVTSQSDTENKLYAGKLIFSRPLLSGQFSLGGEYSHTQRDSEFRNPEGLLKDDDSQIKEGSSALFTEYSRDFGKVNIQAGVRFENIIFDYYVGGVRKDEQSKKYNNVFPSLSLSMPIGKTQMQLSYATDVSRPTYHMLRNRVEYANRYTYESGNPFLLPSITHNLSFTAVYKWWQLYAGFQHVLDDFIYMSESYANDPTIALLQERNTSAYDKVNLSLSASPTLGCWSPQFRVGLRKQWYKVETPDGDVRLNDPMFSASWQNAIALPQGIVFNVDINWSDKSYEQNRVYAESWGVNVSLYKGFLNNRLTLLLQGNDIFNTRRMNYWAYYGKLRTASQNSEPNMRSGRLTVRYMLNTSKSKYKGTGAGKSQKERL